MTKTKTRTRNKRQNTMKRKKISKKISRKTFKKEKQNNKVYTKEDFNSGDGMLTSVWGPSLWHYLHTMSFNYPVKPTKGDKKNYKDFIISLKNVLPCRYCRENLKNNLKELPITNNVLKNRETFSRYIFDLHEHINKMLGKKSGLTYNEVRERYEHFRSRCTMDLDTLLSKKFSKTKTQKNKNRTTTKEKGCVKPLYGKKSKCIIKIVPQEEKCETFQIDKKCMKQKL